MPRVERLDAAALALIVYDILLLDDTELGRPTPCPGWTVADLVSHMDDQHEKISAQAVGPRPHWTGELRHDFAVGAARWTQALAPGTSHFDIPGVGHTVPTRQVQAVHFIDMLTHRWDLAKSLGHPGQVDEVLTDAALPIARAVTAPGSLLLGVAYQPNRYEDDSGTPIDRLAAILGRDPHWQPADEMTPDSLRIGSMRSTLLQEQSENRGME